MAARLSCVISSMTPCDERGVDLGNPRGGGAALAREARPLARHRAGVVMCAGRGGGTPTHLSAAARLVRTRQARCGAFEDSFPILNHKFGSTIFKRDRLSSISHLPC